MRRAVVEQTRSPQRCASPCPSPAEHSDSRLERGAHTGGTYYTIQIDSIEFLDFYGGFANLSVVEYLAYKPSADSPAHVAAPAEAPTTTSKADATSAFCDQVAANSGCCPACGYKWSGSKCVTTQPADTPYCKLLTEPKHGGCCVYCGHVWSAAEGKCVNKNGAAVEEA